MTTGFKISETKEHGAILKINDIELADEFDDFLNEHCYVFSELNFTPDCVYFYFGQASCVEKVKELVKKFMNKEENLAT